MKTITAVAALHLFTGLASPILYLNGYHALGMFLFSVSPAVLIFLVYLVLKDKSYSTPESFNGQWYQDNERIKFSHTSEWEEQKPE